MPDAPTVQLVGVPQATHDLERWAEQLGPAVADGSHEFAGRVVDRVRGEVPVLSGTLAGSVHWDTEPDGVAIGYGDVVYAGWIEFGGGHGRPYIPEGRYLFPTAADSEQDWYDQAADVATHTAERFPWSKPT